jgi:hypothetical protein
VIALQPVAELVRSAEEDRLTVEHAGEATAAPPRRRPTGVVTKCPERRQGARANQVMREPDG